MPRSPVRLPSAARSRLRVACLSLAVCTASPALARQHDHSHHAPPPPANAATPGTRPDTLRHGPVWTLEEVLAQVEDRHPGLRAARLSARAAGTLPDRASALPDPMLTADVMAGQGRMARSEWMAEQAFPWPGTLAARRRAAEAEASGVAASAAVLAADLRMEATVAYVEAAGLQQKIERLDRYRSGIEGFEQAAVSRYGSGTGSQQAVLRVQLEKNMVDEKRWMLEAELADRLERLARLAGGERPADPTLLLPRFEAPAPTGVHRPVDLAVPAADSARAEAERAMARLEFRPMLAARAGFTEGSIMRGNRDAVTLGAAVSIPLWRAPRTAALEAARLEVRRAEAMLEEERQRIATGRAAALARIGFGRRQLDLVDRTLLPQAEATHLATVSAYTNGLADYLELLDAERMLLELELSRIDRLVALARDAAEVRRYDAPLEGPRP